MKGIILAGGTGTRLSPLTKVASKQLLPIYNKPLIYYSIATLMLAGLKEILIIVSASEKSKFEELLGTGRQFGVTFKYVIQEKPEGLAQSMILAEDFLAGEKSCLILGDNIFHGPGLGRSLVAHKEVVGAFIFGYAVKNPEAYGIATIGIDGLITNLEEKPVDSKSNLAIPGLYFFDHRASAFAKELKPSPRGELEIIDLLQCYHEEKLLHIAKLPLGSAWFDSGTFSDMHDASTYVRLMEERTGIRVGNPEDVALVQGWIK